MKWPRLVVPWACRVPVTLRLVQGDGEDGAPIEARPIHTLCSLDERQRQVLDKERRMVRLAAVLLFDGDPAPGMAEIAGRAELADGRCWDILRAERARDPDGGVNYTRLEVF